MISKSAKMPFLKKYLCIILSVSIVMTALFTSGCGYSLTGTNPQNNLNAGQAIWVDFISNDTISTSAQTVIRRALLSEAHGMRGMLPSATSSSADLIVSGRLLSYSTGAVSYSSIDQVKEYRLYISAELELRRKGEKGKAFWKGTISTYQDYPVDKNNDLALQRSAEEAALAAASRKMAQKFIFLAEQSY
jgi:hypothetical protein